MSEFVPWIVLLFGAVVYCVYMVVTLAGGEHERTKSSSFEWNSRDN